MSPRIVLLSLLIASTPLSAAPLGIVSAQEWARPRTGDAVAQMPGLSAAVNAYLRAPDKVISLHHPVEEEGLLWAEEMKTWLVALGVASNDIELVASLMDTEQIEIHLSEPR